MRISADIYQDSRLSPDDRSRLEAAFDFMHSTGGMDKEAASGTGGMARDIAQTALAGAASGAALFGAGLMAEAGVQGVRQLLDRAAKKRDLDKILGTFPEIEGYPEGDIQLAYNAMRHVNPHFAKDPLIGGTLLKQLLRQRDPDNPRSLRFEGGLAVDLVRSAPRPDDTISRLATESFTSGMGSALKSRDDQAFRREQTKADHEFKQLQEEDRQKFTTAVEAMRQAAQVDLEGIKNRNARHRDIIKAHYSGTRQREDPSGVVASPEDMTSILQAGGMLGAEDHRFSP